MVNIFEEYVSSIRWKYAKTMPQFPHEYTLKEWYPDKYDLFEKFVMYIRENGYDDYFYRRKFRYIKLGDYKYWTMGEPLEKTILINRSKL